MVVDEQGDFFGMMPITLWCCSACGYVDVVRAKQDRACPGCEKETFGRTHRYRPDPIGVRTDRDRLSVVPAGVDAKWHHPQ